MLLKFHLALAIALLTAVLSAADGVVVDKNRVVDGRADLSDMFGKASADKKNAALAVARAHERDEVCLDYAGDVLTWGLVEDYVDLQLLEAPLNIPPQATLEQINKIVASSKIRLAEVAINTYLREALMAHLAIKAGLSVSDDELTNALYRATLKASRKKHGGEIVPKLRNPDSYFGRYQKNYLLSRKYRDFVLNHDIDVTPDEIENCISNREAAIAAAIATNEIKRVTIEGFLEKIRSGELDFGETAYEHSDCGSSMDNGDWGEFERDCSLLQPLKDFVFAPSKVEMSDVIETPYSYHIVKILERHYDADEANEVHDEEPTDAPPSASDRSPVIVVAVIFVCAIAISGLILVLMPKNVSWRLYVLFPVWGVAVLAAVLAFRFASGDSPRAPTRVHIAHIMLEKEVVPPSLDADAARVEISRQKLAKRMVAVQAQALEAAQTNGTLKCAVRMTLLNKSKMLKKAKEQKEKNHEK